MSKAAPASLPKGIRQRSTHVPKMWLTLAQVQNNSDALDHAELLGLRPNVTLDINFSVGDLFEPDQNAGTSLRSFLKLARQWIERRGGQTAYIYVFENRHTRIGEAGIHAHILIHVPDDLRKRFHELKRGWANNKQVGMTWKPGVLSPKGQKRKPIPTLKAVKGKLLYMCKDLDPVVLAKGVPFLEARGTVLDDRGKPSTAPIYGLKTGVSRNINAKARATYRQRLPNKSIQ